MCRRIAACARLWRSSGASTPSGSTSRSNRRHNASRAGRVASARSGQRAHRSYAAALARRRRTVADSFFRCMRPDSRSEIVRTAAAGGGRRPRSGRLPPPTPISKTVVTRADVRPRPKAHVRPREFEDVEHVDVLGRCSRTRGPRPGRGQTSTVRRHSQFMIQCPPPGGVPAGRTSELQPVEALIVEASERR